MNATPRQRNRVATVLLVLLFGIAEASAWPCGNEILPQEDRRSPSDEENVASLTERLRASTPPFPSSDREIVAKALSRARELFLQHGSKIRGLIVATLGGREPDEVVDWFFSQYSAKLASLAPEKRLYDGRRSSHVLPTVGVTIQRYFGRDRYLAALVTEIKLGEHAIFVGPRFFEIGQETQAQLLLHETVHMLGASFGDEAIDPVLRDYPWYDPKAPASDNLQRFFTEFCRRVQEKPNNRDGDESTKRVACGGSARTHHQRMRSDSARLREGGRAWLPGIGPSSSSRGRVGGRVLVIQ